MYPFLNVRTTVFVLLGHLYLNRLSIETFVSKTATPVRCFWSVMVRIYGKWPEEGSLVNRRHGHVQSEAGRMMSEYTQQRNYKKDQHNIQKVVVMLCQLVYIYESIEEQRVLGSIPKVRRFRSFWLVDACSPLCSCGPIPGSLAFF